MTVDLSRADLKALDASDPLKDFKDRFCLPDGLVYMNGNSLGPLSVDAKARMVQAVSEEWGEQLIKGWNTAGWYDIPGRIGDKIAQIIGANPGETVLCDSTSVNLFKAVSAALSLNSNSKRTKILSEAGNFPTDLYILNGIRQFARGDYQVEIVDRDAVMAAIDAQTAVVVLTHVHYVSGAIFPMEEITRKAHEIGALVVWDLSHSVGAIETNLNAAKADFAVGCGYKHLNGGPGAPAFLFAAERHHSAMQQPLSGWFAHDNPFAFTDEFVPAGNIRRMLTGTTGVLGASAFEASIDLFLEASSSDRYKKREKLSSLFQQLVDSHCGGLGLTLISPAQASMRGAHISYRHEQGYAIMQNLIHRGVIGDFRAPDFMRFGFSPLFMSYENLYDAALILQDILQSRSYEADQFQVVNKVT